MSADPHDNHAADRGCFKAHKERSCHGARDDVPVGRHGGRIEPLRSFSAGHHRLPRISSRSSELRSIAQLELPTFRVHELLPGGELRSVLLFFPLAPSCAVRIVGFSIVIVRSRSSVAGSGETEMPPRQCGTYGLLELDVGLHRFQQPHQLALTALTGVPQRILRSDRRLCEIRRRLLVRVPGGASSEVELVVGNCVPTWWSGLGCL